MILLNTGEGVGLYSCYWPEESISAVVPWLNCCFFWIRCFLDCYCLWSSNRISIYNKFFSLYILIHLTLKVCNRFTACRKWEISFPFLTKEHLPSSVPMYKPFATSLTEYNVALGPAIVELGLFGCMILLSFYM